MSQTLINKGFKPLSQLSVFIGVFGGSLIVAAIATFIFISASGLPLTNTEALMQPENIPAMRWLQAITTLFMFGLPAILFAFICFRNGGVALGFGHPWQWKLAALAIAIMLAAGPLTDALGTLNKAIPLPANLRAYFDGMEKNYESQVKAMLNVDSWQGLFMSILLIAALPALVEELFFRSTMQGLFMRWFRNPWLAIGFTALIFSAIHLSWYGFFPRLMLGVVLGLVYYITGNIWYSILMHFFNNAVAVLYLFYLHQQDKPMDMSDTSMFPIWTALIAIVVLILLLRLLYKKHPPEMQKEIIDNHSDPFANRNVGHQQPHTL